MCSAPSWPPTAASPAPSGKKLDRAWFEASFDETLPGFSPVVSHVPLYLWNLLPCLIGLAIVYIGQYQRLRMFVVHNRLLTTARGQARVQRTGWRRRL